MESIRKWTTDADREAKSLCLSAITRILQLPNLTTQTNKLRKSIKLSHEGKAKQKEREKFENIR